MSLLFTFPGQGSQHVGMLQTLPDHPACRLTLDEAQSVLARSAHTLDSASALQSTVAVQLCLLIAGVASARLLSAEVCTPDMVAGLSVGAFAAAVCAGALDFSDALRVVQLRAQLMEQAYPQGYGMTAISGRVRLQIQSLLLQAQERGRQLYLANINTDHQLVIAGHVHDLDWLEDQCSRSFAQCQRLNVHVPSHCTLLDAAADQLQLAFSSVRVHAPHIDYLSSNAVRVIRQPALLAQDLVRNMATMVCWQDTCQLAYERGARLAVEMLPGNILSRLSRPVFAPGMTVALASTRLDSLRVLQSRQTSH